MSSFDTNGTAHYNMANPRHYSQTSPCRTVPGKDFKSATYNKDSNIIDIVWDVPLSPKVIIAQ